MSTIVEGLIMSESDEQAPVLGKEAEAPAACTSIGMVRSVPAILVTLLVVSCFWASPSRAGSPAAADFAEVQGLVGACQRIQGPPNKPGGIIQDEWDKAFNKFSALPEKMEPLTKIRTMLDKDLQTLRSASVMLNRKTKDMVFRFSGHIGSASSKLDNVDRRFVGFCDVTADVLTEEGKMLKQQIENVGTDQKLDIGDAKELLRAIVKESKDFLEKLRTELENVKNDLTAAKEEIKTIVEYIKQKDETAKRKIKEQMDEYKRKKKQVEAAEREQKELESQWWYSIAEVVQVAATIACSVGSAVEFGDPVAEVATFAFCGGAAELSHTLYHQFDTDNPEQIKKVVNGLHSVLDKFERVSTDVETIWSWASTDLDEMTDIDNALKKEGTFLRLDTTKYSLTQVMNRNEETVCIMKNVISRHTQH